jgi:hypothetical protein
MDLRLYSRVLWRFRWLVAIGFVLACLLSFFSVASLSFAGGPKVSYRQPQTWRSTVLLFVTQKGFPYGYTVLPSNQTPPGANGVKPTNFGSPGWFTNLAVFYAPFVQSDPFTAMLRSRTGIKGTIAAQAVVDSHNLPQPYIDLYAYAATQADAMRLANTASSVFQRYIVQQQIAAKIPGGKRVMLQPIAAADKHTTTLFAARKKTTPIVIFLTVLLAAVGLAFVLENLRPRVALASDDEAQQSVAARRPA